MTELNLKELHAFAIDLAKRAGAMITASSSTRSAQNNSTSADASKKNRVDRKLPLPLSQIQKENHHYSLNIFFRCT
jgi:hypothetical protein